ncbi:MAG: NFACT family protein [Oscillospiraceae bacterium]
MALDAATLALVARELKARLAEARVDKIHQPSRDEVLLQMRTRAATFRLLLCARSGFARVCLTEETYENPATPPSFCMLMRKHFQGGRLIDVRTPPGERIVFFDFACTNELGEPVQKTLAAELMGRYCNLVLVAGFPPLVPQEAGEPPLKIIDALKRVDFEDSAVRQLLPGLPYTLPPRPEKLDFLTFSREALAARFAGEARPVEGTLQKAVGGVGPVVLREVLFRAFGAAPPQDAPLSEGQLGALFDAVGQVRRDADAGGVPTLVRKPDGDPTEFSFTRLTQYLPTCTLERYPSFSQMLEAYYAQKDRAERLRQRSRALRKTVQNLYDRAVRKQAARQEDLAKSGESDTLREKGELLTANLGAFQRGDAAVTLQSWTSGEMVPIRLDVRLSPSANAQRYFKEYKRKQTAAKMMDQLLRAGEREIAYLETVLYEVDHADTQAALDEIRAELKSQGYLRYYKPRDKKQKPAEPLRYTSSDGFAILAGRNNAQNEAVTLKAARGKDLWFHVKNAPGSHVVVLSGGADIPLATQNEAAMLAVWHSSQRQGAKVPVDYTEVKHIRKTADLPLGMVLYEHYQTAFVTPEAAVLRRLGAMPPQAAEPLP